MEIIENFDNDKERFIMPDVNPWLIAISVMLATFMEVLDTTVANVALPSIAGSFSASNEESTWALTSYLVSNAIVLPATAWLSSFFGRKNFFLGCIILFSLASLLCGMSNNLETLIIMRILQGIGGGALQPVSQSILLESFPPEKRGLATAVFALGVVVAPILGPFLGGWITDNFSWRWIFFVNLPVGILSSIMCWLFIKEKKSIQEQKISKIDYTGFGLMAIAIAALQIALDKGQQLDWFESKFIVFTAMTSLITFIAFIFWELKTEEPIVNLRIFKDKNFAIGIVSITALGAVLYGTIVLLPLYLQTIMGYTAQLSGMALSPRGIGSFFCILIIGKFIDKYDGRLFLAAGFFVLGIACLLLSNVNLSIDMASVIMPNVLSGIGMGLIFIPLTTLTFATLRKVDFATGTGLFNLMRNIGGSIGISMVSTFLHRFSQAHQTYLIDGLSPYNPIYNERVASLTAKFVKTVDPANATYLAQGFIHRELIRQSNVSAFVDDLRLFALLCFIIIPLAFLFSNLKKKKD